MRLPFIPSLVLIFLLLPAPLWAVDANPPTDPLVQSPTRRGETRSLRSNPHQISPGYFDLLGGTATLRGTFEAGGGLVSPFGWTGVDVGSAGDFSDFFNLPSDSDNCSNNTTAVAGFYSGTHTHPSTNYGLPGFPVVPYGGALPIYNEIRSPVIPWDLPGTADDGGDWAGAQLRFSVWKHLPFEHGIGYYWRIRTRSGGFWSPWKNNGVVEYGSDLGIWMDEVHDLTHLLPQSFDDLQVALGVIDRSGDPGIPGGGATLSPMFDEIMVQKYQVGGPVLVAHDIDLFQDSFPQSGNTDASTQVSRDAMDVRVDVGRTVSTIPNEAQDRLHVLVRPVIDGSGIDIGDIQMVIAVHINPYFEAAIRPNLFGLAGSSLVAGGGINGWDMLLHSVAAFPAVDANSIPIPDTYAFDLPDENCLYPGDILEYYVEATDFAGRRTTLPADISGFGDGVREDFDPVFQMRALPTIQFGGQPDLLFVNQAGYRGGVATYRMALKNLGMIPGVDYDEYVTMQPELVQSNSIGSSGVHGATGAQLEGYPKLLYVAGNLDRNVLSNGTAGNPYDTAADDAGVITAWSALAGDRAIAYFGDDIATAHDMGFGGGSPFLANQMRISLVDDRLSGLPTQEPCVLPVAGGFTFPYAIGPCGVHADFDEIAPLPGAFVSHRYQDVSCFTSGKPAAVVWDRSVLTYAKRDLTHTFDLTSILDPISFKTPNASASYLEELFAYMLVGGSGPPTAVPVAWAELRIQAHPNPANPRATIEVDLPAPAEAQVRIFNVRGEVVRVVWSGDLPAGRSPFVWDGQDQRGEKAPSGVYFARIDAGSTHRTQKLVLLK